MLPILQKNKIPIQCCGEYRTMDLIRGKKEKGESHLQRKNGGSGPKEGRLSEGGGNNDCHFLQDFGPPSLPKSAAALASPSLLIEKVSSLPSPLPLPLPPLSVTALPGLEPRARKRREVSISPSSSSWWPLPPLFVFQDVQKAGKRRRRRGLGKQEKVGGQQSREGSSRHTSFFLQSLSFRVRFHRGAEDGSVRRNRWRKKGGK